MSGMEPLDAVETQTVFSEWRARKAGDRRDLGRADALRRSLGLAEIPPLLAVVGSKGKGTTVAHASAVLAAAGLRVGTLQSPGATSNLDRIRVDGVRLDPSAYAALLRRVDDARRTLPGPRSGYLSPTGYFTVAGMAAFVEHACDVIVAEAGLGGRSDELSIFTPRVAAVSEVFLEHTGLLGSTVAEIARDKAGIAGAGTRAIVYLRQSTEATREISERAAATGARLVAVDSAGGFGEANRRLGVTAARELLAELDLQAPDEAATEQAGASVSYVGRSSVHRSATGAVVVDSAISRPGLEGALEFARAAFGRDPDRVLVSIGRDKDLSGFIAALGALRDRVTFVDLPGTHLDYPDRSEWPYSWATAAELPALLSTGDVLAVGTVSFTSETLRLLDVDASRLFAGRGSRRPQTRIHPTHEDRE